jgi:hypothetical protein
MVSERVRIIRVSSLACQPPGPCTRNARRGIRCRPGAHHRCSARAQTLPIPRK